MHSRGKEIMLHDLIRKQLVLRMRSFFASHRWNTNHKHNTADTGQTLQKPHMHQTQNTQTHQKQQAQIKNVLLQGDGFE